MYCTAQAGLNPKPEIMVPVVSTAKELRLIVPRIEAAVANELKKAGVEVGIRWWELRHLLLVLVLLAVVSMVM